MREITYVNRSPTLLVISIFSTSICPGFTAPGVCFFFAGPVTHQLCLLQLVYCTWKAYIFLSRHEHLARPLLINRFSFFLFSRIATNVFVAWFQYSGPHCVEHVSNVAIRTIKNVATRYISTNTCLFVRLSAVLCLVVRYPNTQLLLVW